MNDATPDFLRYESVQKYLSFLNFEINDDFFVRGNIQFSITEIAGFTPASFHEKAKSRGWLELPAIPDFLYLPCFQMD